MQPDFIFERSFAAIQQAQALKEERAALIAKVRLTAAGTQLNMDELRRDSISWRGVRRSEAGVLPDTEPHTGAER